MTESRILVIGPGGVVGPFIVDRLVRAGHRPLCMARKQPSRVSDIDWVAGDLTKPESIPTLPPLDDIYCIAGIARLPEALPALLKSGSKRLIVFSSTSVFTKANSEVLAERETARLIAEGERRTIEICNAHGVDWTILRPTLIYAEGRDANVTRLAKVIARFGIFPLIGKGKGLRQPVHGDDLATAALLARASSRAVNKVYDVPGGETLSYYEMIGRLFDSLGKRRRIISVPIAVWRFGFAFAKPLLPNVTVAMGMRMSKDMVFDGSQAQQDLDWHPREFRPQFDAIH